MSTTKKDILQTAKKLRTQVGGDFHQKLVETIYTDAAGIADRAVIRPDQKEKFDLDRAIDLHLEPVARLRTPLLERRMQRFLAESSDVRWGSHCFDRTGGHASVPWICPLWNQLLSPAPCSNSP